MNTNMATEILCRLMLHNGSQVDKLNSSVPATSDGWTGLKMHFVKYIKNSSCGGKKMQPVSYKAQIFLRSV
jgi:hypothetical protein